MSNNNKDSNNSMLIGALIGGVVGALATAIYLSSKDEGHECKSSSSSAFGRIIMQMGEMLSSEDMRKTHVTKGVEKNAQKYEDTVSDVLRLVSSGMNLWEKIKKG